MPISPTLSSRVRVKDDVLFQELNGEGVLLNLKTGVYFGLDPIGTRFWQLLDQHTILSEILEALLAEYDVPQERCAQDLVALAADMEKHELIALS
jgi:coenzyme PQQ synthesis protein D (PqqD)